MKAKPKGLLFSVCAVLLVHAAAAQLKFPGAGNPDVRNALEKVISDYGKDFATLKAEVQATNPQTVEYGSRLQFKSAESDIIIQHSGNPPVYSWQARMATAEDFEAAEKKYKALYAQLKGMNLKLNRDYDYTLSGDYSKPEESKGFSSTVFHLSPAASYLPKVKVELSLQYELMEWKIYLLVYQKEKEDSERGRREE